MTQARSIRDRIVRAHGGTAMQPRYTPDVSWQLYYGISAVTPKLLSRRMWWR